MGTYGNRNTKSGKYSEVYAMVVSGGNVYVAGYESDDNGSGQNMKAYNMGTEEQDAAKIVQADGTLSYTTTFPKKIQNPLRNQSGVWVLPPL
jgi:hypothetical protein